MEVCFDRTAISFIYAVSFTWRLRFLRDEIFMKTRKRETYAWTDNEFFIHVTCHRKKHWWMLRREEVLRRSGNSFSMLLREPRRIPEKVVNFSHLLFIFCSRTSSTVGERSRSKLNYVYRRQLCVCYASSVVFRHPPPSRAIKILVNAIFMGLVTFIFYCYCRLNEQSAEQEEN